MVDARTEVEIETAPNPTFTVIWLHGLGADGNDFVPIVPELGLPKSAAVRFIFPHAEQMPVTINGGYRMPAWYDILSLDGSNRKIDEAGILATRNRIRALITRENARGIPCERIVLAGFSQGGSMAYTIGLTQPEKLAGIMPLSAYLPAPDLLKNFVTNKYLLLLPPIFTNGTDSAANASLQALISAKLVTILFTKFSATVFIFILNMQPLNLYPTASKSPCIPDPELEYSQIPLVEVLKVINAKSVSPGFLKSP